MSLHLHWYLPTNGDGRGIVGSGRAGSGGVGDSEAVDRAPDIDYLAQIARAYPHLVQHPRATGYAFAFDLPTPALLDAYLGQRFWRGAVVFGAGTAGIGIADQLRDAMMAEEAEHYPAYGFESNRGYPAPHHKCALAGYGPSAIHRRSWIFMDNLVWGGLAPAPGRLF